MKYGVVMKLFKLNILVLLLNGIYVIKGNNCYVIDCVKELNCWHAFKRS